METHIVVQCEGAGHRFSLACLVSVGPADPDVISIRPTSARIGEPGCVHPIGHGCAISVAAIRDAARRAWPGCRPRVLLDFVLKVRCPVCAHISLPASGNYDICSRCGWEDDGQNDARQDEDGGPNHMSLRVARRMFNATGRTDDHSAAVARWCQYFDRVANSEVSRARS